MKRYIVTTADGNQIVEAESVDWKPENMSALFHPQKLRMDGVWSVRDESEENRKKERLSRILDSLLDELTK